MTRRHKLLLRIRNSPRNVTLRDLAKLLKAYGFSLRRVKGSHHIFDGHVAGCKLHLSVPFAQPIKEAYVKDVLELIDQIESEESDEQGGQ